MKLIQRAVVVLVGMLSIMGCSSSDALAPATLSPADAGEDAGPTDGGDVVEDAEWRRRSAVAMHDALLVDVRALASAAGDVQSAAPLATEGGWDETRDAETLTKMRAAWTRARTAYEHIEGALAPLFPDIDTAIDARYDDFLLTLGSAGDPNAFDDQGVTGMHAIERILFANTTPSRVVDFEKGLAGYSEARIPQTVEEAADFKNRLCAKLVADVSTLEGEWTPANIDVEIAYSGLVSLVLEQREKVQKAATNEEESRYSQRTMTDLRDNLTGTKTAYAAFRPWILSKEGGADLDARVAVAFSGLDAAYADVSGEGIPEPPSTWSAENPSESDRATPFGRLYTAVEKEVDETSAASLVGTLGLARELLGLRKLE